MGRQVHLRVTDDYERRRSADPALSIGLVYWWWWWWWFACIVMMIMILSLQVSFSKWSRSRDSQSSPSSPSWSSGLAYMAALCSYRGSLNPARALGPAFVANRFGWKLRILLLLLMVMVIGGGEGGRWQQVFLKSHWSWSKARMLQLKIGSVSLKRRQGINKNQIGQKILGGQFEIGIFTRPSSK